MRGIPRVGLNGKGPKRKGDAYERELAAYLNEHVFGREAVYRAPLSGGGRQFFGGGGSSDLTGTPFVWVEAKRTERFSPYEAITQAERGIAGKKAQEVPVVVTRRSRIDTGESLVVMRLADWSELYRAFLTLKGVLQEAPAVAGASVLEEVA